MLGTWLSLVFSIVLLIGLYALSDRLQFLTNKAARGRGAFFAGTMFLLLGSLWTALRFRPEYQDWFVPGAYTFIDIAHLIVIISGLFFVIYGISRFFDSLIEFQAQVEYREQKLNILENLQRDAREPYQFLELLNHSIKEIVSTIPECSGAVFLVGRNRKQFVLATSIGLTSGETGRLEYYPFGENDISQAVDSGEPVLAGSFAFTDENGDMTPSRFNSILVLPLISGMDKIGGIVLFSTIERIFEQSDIRSLAPVGEWLAEKIKSARATRELGSLRKEKEEEAALFNESTSQIEKATSAFNAPDLLNNLCSNLKGFAQSESVHLAAVMNGSLEILGGSKPMAQLSEEYAEALENTIVRGKPSVVNQNSENETGRSITLASTLVYPLDGNRANHAIILLRQSEPFILENFQLKVLSIFSRLCTLALNKSELEKLEMTRRLGFDKVVNLLRLPARLSFDEDPGFFTRHLASLLPPQATALTFVSQNGNLKLADIFGGAGAIQEDLLIKMGEGFIGRTAQNGTPLAVSGKREFERVLDEFTDENKELLINIIGRTNHVSFLLTAPFSIADRVAGVVAFLLPAMFENERREWERLISLASNLYSMRMTLASLSQKQTEIIPDERVNQIINAVNNNLAAVIGNAEILMTKNGLDNGLRDQLQSIMNEAELASAQIKNLSGPNDKKSEVKTEPSAPDLSLNEVAKQILKHSHISENLYMVAGRAREIEFKPGEIGRLELSSAVMQELFSGAINKFASLAESDDIITISTYNRDNHIYLDISRHRRNFPPVESVAGFGNYQLAEEALKTRPADKYLEKLSGSIGKFAYDRFSTAPSYLSFKFPMKRKSAQESLSGDTVVEILAVDDQPVILELISAMCQSIGFKVTTALSGAEAINFAKKNKYDVILTDLAMPGMSGLELSRILRNEHPDTPIILITGWEATIDRDELEDSGITDVLYKPFRIEQLTNLVKAAATGQSA